jgi:hypothetical protein
MRCAKTSIAILIIFFLNSMISLSVASQNDIESKPEIKLIGTWKMLTAKYGGMENDFPKRLTVLKYVTQTHFIWIRINPENQEIIQSAGGTCSINDDTYTETALYGFGADFTIVRDQTFTFKWKIENEKWYHTTTLANGMKIEEVWERVK